MRKMNGFDLWIGNALHARDLRMLYEHEIAAVVDLAIEEKPAELGRDIIYLRVPLIDGAGNSPAIIRLAIETVAHLMRSRITTLVACGAGMCRSPAIVAAALARIEESHPDESLEQLVRDQPHDLSPLLWADVRRVCEAC
jgi:protein-tyrosine phosphatase